MAPRRPPPVPVYLEIGSTRVFACAYRWPGWCRSAKTAEGALDALGAAGPRYARVADEAGVRFPAPDAGAFDVRERLPGSATTDFGAPGAIPGTDTEPLGAPERRRTAALLHASWRVFDDVVATAPARLRKGPRGGGRDRDEIAVHMAEAERSFARKIGLRFAEPADTASVRAQLVDRLIEIGGAGGVPDPPPGTRAAQWPARYAARRLAWHVLDHAWEIEDKRD